MTSKKKKKKKAKVFSIRIEPIESTGADAGREAVVYTPLSGEPGKGKETKLYLSDFARIIAEHGCILDWKYNSNRRHGAPGSKAMCGLSHFAAPWKTVRSVQNIGKFRC